jgi:hypothetical protein
LSLTVLSGGVTSRLVEQLVDIEAVLKGPSAEATLHWECNQVFHHGRYLIDNDITRAEMEIVCGFYLPPDQEPVSRWPFPEIFLNSDMWTGWWSPNCKQWFQESLGEIKRKEARPLTARGWEDSLGKGSISSPLRQRNSLRSSYLLSHLI